MSDEQGGNMRVWDALIGTDPQHTSTFKRAGGFSGTAMRPMWAIKHMTEQFGPIGIGWGFEETGQKIIEAGEEMLVYSKASVWYADGAQIAHTPSQWGGDKIMVKRRDGSVQSDDEAPKKALTDAVLKCLSYIGLGADIHLGQFEDSKYVEEINQQYREQEQAPQIEEWKAKAQKCQTKEQLSDVWYNMPKALHDPLRDFFADLGGKLPSEEQQ